MLFQMEHLRVPAGLWVLKPVFSASASNRRAGLGVLAEIVGLHVCGWLGVATPYGGLFRFPEDGSKLVETVAASSRAEVEEVFSLNRNLLAYCSRYIEGSILAEAALLPQRAPNALVDQAARLMAVDLFLCHHDRRIDNANTLLFEDKLVAIDHGDALAGLDRAGETGEGLARRTVLSSAVRSHFLLAWLRRRASDVDWNRIVFDLETAAQTGVDTLLAAIPPELGSAEQNHQQELHSRLRPFLLHRLQVLPDLITNLRSLVEATP